MSVGSSRSAPANLPRLAYVSPLPPLPSGIADYSAELLPALAKHFQITLVLEQAQLDALPADLGHIDTATFLARAADFDHVLYHFGNSPYHAHMVGLLRQVPGVVVLHDVFLGHLMANVQFSGRDPAALRRALWQSHGWPALACWREQGLEAVLQQYPASGEVLAHSRGVIVHSQHARQLLLSWFGASALAPVWVSPLPQAMPAPGHERAQARRRLGIPPDVFLVCAFGYAGPGKMAAELVQAWHDAGLAAQPSAWLRLVGGHQFGGASAAQLEASLQRCIRTTLTGYIQATEYRDYLAAADLAVQLRAASRGETSRAVLEVVAHGIPLIVNAHGANAELPAGWACRLEDPLNPADLAAALAEAWREPAVWRSRAAQACAELAQQHGPEVVAQRYASYLQQSASTPPSWLQRCREQLQAQAVDQGRLAWHQAHRRATQVVRALNDGALPRWRPPLESLALTPRAPLRVGRALNVLMVTDASLAPPRCGNDRRSAALLSAYQAAGFQVKVWSVATIPGSPTVAPPVADWDVVHLDAPLPWQATEAHLSGGRRALRVLALPRRLLVNSGGPTATAYAAAVAMADLVVCHSQEQARAWRGRCAGGVLVIPDAVDPLTYSFEQTQAAREAVLSRGRFAMVPGFQHASTLQAFEHWALGASLAYLPPDKRLILVGRIADAMREVPRFQRWAGINLARGMAAGCLDEVAYQAARRHAWVKVILPGLAPEQPAPSMRLLEALQDPGWILVTRAALRGTAWAWADPRVVVEDDAARFRERLVSLLNGPAAPEPEAWRAPTWSEVTPVLPLEVSRLAVARLSGAQEQP